MTRATSTLFALLSVLGGCGVGVEDDPALHEPVQVVDGTFRSGALPGVEVADPESGEGPRITALEAPGGIAPQGQRGRTVTGRASAEAYAVAMVLDGAGTGYWVRPVDAPDPANKGERTFRFEFDVAESAPVGRQILRFVALDAAGVAGVQRPLRVCVTPPVPDNLNACDPTIAPPAFVVELTWDAVADLDLRVLTPSGRWASAERPRTVDPAAPADGEAPPAPAGPDPTVGVFSGDAGADCRDTGPRRETLVFQEEPAPGAYLVYARLFDACGVDDVPFRATLWTRVSQDDGTWSPSPLQTRFGVQSWRDAGPDGVGTYLFSLDLTGR